MMLVGLSVNVKKHLRIFNLIFMTLYLPACSGPKHSKEVLCEVKGGGSSLQFVRYLQSSYPRIGRVAGGESRYEGIYFDAGAKFWKSRWIMEGIDFSWDQDYVEEACKKNSKIDGSLIILSPVPRQFHNFNITSRRNRVMTSVDGGGKFNLIYFPELGYPYLQNSKGDYLTYPRWITRDMDVGLSHIKLVQVTLLKEPFNLNDVKGKVDIHPWLEFKGKGCAECEPVIFRNLESLDGGRSWKVTGFGVLRPEILPEDALPLSAKNVYWFRSSELYRRDPNEGREFNCPANTSHLDDLSKQICGLTGSFIPL